MPVLGPDRAQIRVFTYKEGLLSTVAHDLQIAVRRFQITVEDTPEGITVRAEIDAGSLEVVSAMKAGALDPGTLKDKDKAEIAGNIRDDVLHVSRHPSIRFESTSLEASTLRGRLTLHGATREITLSLQDSPGRRRAELKLDQRDFGIKPYSALLGALKVQPVVKVEIELPWP